MCQKLFAVVRSSGQPAMRLGRVFAELHWCRALVPHNLNPPLTISCFRSLLLLSISRWLDDKRILTQYAVVSYLDSRATGSFVLGQCRRPKIPTSFCLKQALTRCQMPEVSTAIRPLLWLV